ncbi:helix-turn-helix domain-containing protein [Streptosporangium carneum]|uniref:AraC family transcriptional regulator n=1 Tax=Streptosporangium carneum TaxID=47481 RepID=A0A9W6HYV1_9ACTN|nr:helix-turn-helix domain-containing protein [Streptosporangium carneum]GLK08821.1 AraC family transcriptional regulator [Streptosporangium carneum]
MRETVFRSDDLPAADRFAWWHEMASRALVPTLARSDHEAEFHATLRLLDFGAVRLSWLSYPSLWTRRTEKLIRRSDPDMYCLSLTLRGTMRLDHHGRQAVAHPQDLLLYDTSHPFHGQALADGSGSVEGMILQIPRNLMPVPAATLARLTATRLPSRDGVGALLRRHLGDLVRHAPQCTTADATRLSALTLDLLAATCAHYLEAEAALPAETNRGALRARVHAFIQRQLADPSLSPDTIAAAHQISTRHLYQLFNDQGLTVAAWIRRQRLERCRRDLADPNLCPRPIHAIAARWGFSNNAHFSRLFRASYGLSPADYRNQVQHGAVQESATTVRELSTTF